MAKKKNIEAELPVASVLVMPKQQVIDLINAQIEKSKALLGIEVPYRTVRRGMDVFGGGGHLSKEYDEEQKTTFFNEFHKWDNRNVEILTRAFEHPNNKDCEGYKQAGVSYFWEDVVVEHKKSIIKQVAYLQGFIERIDLIPCNAKPLENRQQTNSNVSEDKVFIVHGHNELLKVTVARTLEQMGLKPIILHEQEDYGKTIIEKFESNSTDVGFAVVLLTADDLGISKKDKENAEKEGSSDQLSARARQNVVFEMGYFMGKLDRAHVFLLLEEGVEKPGDLDGIIYTAVDSEGMWKYKLAKRLKSVGYHVNSEALL